MPLADQNFQVSANIDSATLNAMTNVTDYISGNSFSVSIDLIWTGTGPLGRTRLNSFTRNPDCKMITHINGTVRPVEVSGTVTSETANYTPEPPVYANLGSDMAGNVTFGCQ